MAIPSAESIEGTLGIGSADELLKAMRTMSACAIGPGLSTNTETAHLIRGLVQRITIPAVIDADGLNALVGFTDMLKRVKSALVLTPHPGEMGSLLGISSDDVQRDRITIASAFARKHNVTVVLKGAATVVATPHGWVFVNSTGNPGMASGGTGDVLTGMIGSFIAQGYFASQAACLGVYLHGRAGDLAAEEKGEASMIAGDLIEKIPQAFKEIME
jgi:NAD(P)H-hydrate epimerase